MKLSIIDNAVSLAIRFANEKRRRFLRQENAAMKYDDSSFIIDAFERVGVRVASGGATNAMNMMPVFLSKGFKNVTRSIDLKTGAGLQKGDVLLNTLKHSALYIGDGRLIHMRLFNFNVSPEIRAYFNYPWNCVLRYGADKSA